MKKIVSALIGFSILLGLLPTVAHEDYPYIFRYDELVDWISSGGDVADMAFSPFMEFVWPTTPETLTANMEKTLNFNPNPAIEGADTLTIPSNMTINGVKLLCGTTENPKGQLNIAGTWNGDVSTVVPLVLTGSVTGDVSVIYTNNTLTGEIDGNLFLREATATVDLVKVKTANINTYATVQGNLTADCIYLADGMEGMSSDLTIQSGSVVDARRLDGTGTITVEKGATLTIRGDSYVDIKVQSGGTLNWMTPWGLRDASLHIEDGGLVNAYQGISIGVEDVSTITGSGTICFWNKRPYIFIGNEGQKEYTTNDGNVPRVDATVKFTSAVCKHVNDDNEWFAEEGYHYYLCDICGADVDGGLHRFDVTLVPGGSSYSCSVCGYVRRTDVFWQIKKGTLSLLGSGAMPELMGYEEAPWYDKRTSIKEVLISDDITWLATSFAQCENLTSVRLPSRLESVHVQMFYQCTGLKQVELSASIEEIGYGAFDGCTSLTDVYFGGTQEEWENVRIGSKNDALKNATVHFNTPMLCVAAEKTETQTTVTVTPSNLETGTELLLGCYQNGVLTDVQIKVYQGTEETFTVTEPYDSIKVMVWENRSNMKAVCTSVIR